MFSFKSPNISVRYTFSGKKKTVDFHSGVSVLWNRPIIIYNLLLDWLPLWINRRSVAYRPRGCWDKRKMRQPEFMGIRLVKGENDMPFLSWVNLFQIEFLENEHKSIGFGFRWWHCSWNNKSNVRSDRGFEQGKVGDGANRILFCK